MLYPEDTYIALLLEYLRMANDLRRMCEEGTMMLQDLRPSEDRE